MKRMISFSLFGYTLFAATALFASSPGGGASPEMSQGQLVSIALEGAVMCVSDKLSGASASTGHVQESEITQKDSLSTMREMAANEDLDSSVVEWFTITEVSVVPLEFFEGDIMCGHFGPHGEPMITTWEPIEYEWITIEELQELYIPTEPLDFEWEVEVEVCEYPEGWCVLAICSHGPAPLLLPSPDTYMQEHLFDRYGYLFGEQEENPFAPLPFYGINHCCYAPEPTYAAEAYWETWDLKKQRNQPDFNWIPPMEQLQISIPDMVAIRTKEQWPGNPINAARWVV